MYRLIVSEKARDPYGNALEILGSYNPFTKELSAKNERINYWLSQGAGLSATVNNLLVAKSVIKREKVKASIARKKKKEVKKENQPEAAKTPVPAPEEKESEPKIKQEKDSEKAKIDAKDEKAENKEEAKKEE